MQREREETRDIVNSETKMIQVLFRKNVSKRKNKTKMIITINVPVVFMAQDVMILTRAISITRAFEGVGPENQNFFGP